jgi:PadR family transcriptional regulator PadR
MSTKKSIVEKHLEQLLFDIKRGFLQYVVLSLIDQGPKYAYEIKKKVYTATDGRFDIDRNNLYKKLRTLEHEGILESHEMPSAHGANRKYYSLTPMGKNFLREVTSLLKPIIGLFHARMKNMHTV